MNTPLEPKKSLPDDENTLFQQNSILSDIQPFKELMDAVPAMLVILNKFRRVVLANQAFIAAFGVPDESYLLGRRPGEVFGCDRGLCATGGCGTSEECCECGALQAITTALAGEKRSASCRMPVHGEKGLEYLNLQMTAAPIIVEKERYVVLYTDQISRIPRTAAT